MNFLLIQLGRQVLFPLALLGADNTAHPQHFPNTPTDVPGKEETQEVFTRPWQSFPCVLMLPAACVPLTVSLVSDATPALFHAHCTPGHRNPLPQHVESRWILLGGKGSMKRKSCCIILYSSDYLGTCPQPLPGCFI